MNNYITAATIKMLREKSKMTQEQLADIISVSAKTVSKWETGRGLPDITLPALEPENDEDNLMNIECVEDEYFISINHEMTKTHYISFAAYVTSDKVQMIKFYPEGNAEARFFIRGTGYLYFYCNHHGLFRKLIR